MTRRPTGRAAASTALLAASLLLLATTQPWVATVTELAPGAPRTRTTVGGAELVPWLAPVTLSCALAVVAGLARMRWARPVAAVASLAVLGGAVQGLLTAARGVSPGERVVSAAPTGWLWVGVAAALVSAVATVLWSAPRPRRPGPDGGSGGSGGEPRPDRRGGDGRPAHDPYGAEAARRRAAADWRDLSEGRDPTQH